MPPPDFAAVDRGPSDLLGQVRRSVGRRLPYLLALILLSGAAAGELTRLRTSTYVSTVSFVVLTTSGAGDTETLIRTMQSLVNSEIIGADLAAATQVDLSPSEVVDKISVIRPPGAGVFTVDVADVQADRSRRLAEGLIPVFQKRVRELSRPEPGELAVTYSIRPWGSGAVSTSVSNAPVVRNALLGLVLGGIVGVLLLGARAASRPVLLSPAQARSAYRLPLLGGLPRARGAEPYSLDALDVILRSGRGQGWPVRPRRVLVVGAGEGRDRTTLMLALAASLAPAGHIRLIDTYGGAGSLTRTLGFKGRQGLADALTGAVNPGETLLPLPDDPRLTGGVLSRGSAEVMPGGVAALTPSHSARLPAVADEVQRDGVVLLDAQSLDGPLNWGPLLQTVDGVLVLATLGVTPVAQARALGDVLLALTDCPVGVLLLESDRLLVPVASEGALAPPTEGTPRDGVLAGTGVTA